MNSVPIYLCDDVLLAIFNHLDFKSLKEATLVCREWNRVIGSSVAIMAKFKIKIGHNYNDNSDYYDDVIASSRKYQSMIVRAYECIDLNSDVYEKFLQTLTKYGEGMKSFESLSVVVLASFDEFCDILALMPSVKELAMKFELEELKPSAVVKQPVLSCVVKLSLETDDCRMFSYLRAVNLETLSVKIRSDEHVHCLIDFLRTLTKLDSLDINLRKGSFKTLFASSKEPFPFRLKKFTTEARPQEPEISNFLLSHSETLEEISLEIDSASVILTIFNHLKCSKVTLKISHRNLIVRSELEAMSPNVYLKELILDRGVTIEQNIMEIILRNLRNLERLSMQSYRVDIASLRNPKLIDLKVGQLHTVFGFEARFNYLQNIDIWKCHDSQQIISFLENNQSVSTLRIRCALNFSEELIEYILRKSTVKHLQLGLTNNAKKLVCDKVIFNSRNLKSMELYDMIEFVPPSISVIFPEDGLRLQSFREQLDQFIDVQGTTSQALEEQKNRRTEEHN